MILEIKKNQYFCTHCQLTWIGNEDCCKCYGGTLEFDDDTTKETATV